MFSSLKTTLDAALHLFYPRLCLVCESRLLEANEKFVCVDCERDFDTFSLPNESTDEMLRRLHKNFPAQTVIQDAISLYRFYKEGKIQAVIHAFKYDGLPQVAVEYGRKLGHKILTERPHVHFDAVTFMPLHRLKYIERGYNQAEQLAAGVADAMHLPVLSCAERTRYTSTQTGLDLSEREANMKGVFRATMALAHKRLLLIDDVFTTGATVLSCARALADAGLAHLTIATLAVSAG